MGVSISAVRNKAAYGGRESSSRVRALELVPVGEANAKSITQIWQMMPEWDRNTVKNILRESADKGVVRVVFHIGPRKVPVNHYWKEAPHGNASAVEEAS